MLNDILSIAKEACVIKEAMPSKWTKMLPKLSEAAMERLGATKPSGDRMLDFSRQIDPDMNLKYLRRTMSSDPMQGPLEGIRSLAKPEATALPNTDRAMMYTGTLGSLKGTNGLSDVPRRVWNEIGGVATEAGSYTPKFNTVSVMSKLLPGVRANKGQYSGHAGTIAHEQGHRWMSQNQDLGLNLGQRIFNKLRPTMPPEAMSDQAHFFIMSEGGAQFRATKGTGFGNRAALKLPIMNGKKYFPNMMNEFDSQMDPRMSPKLKERMLATRSHLLTNYEFPPKSYNLDEPYIKLSSALDQLQQAKVYSDTGRYEYKHAILAKMMFEHPEHFYTSDVNKHHPGITHKPTGFRMHAPRSISARATGTKDEQLTPDQLALIEALDAEKVAPLLKDEAEDLPKWSKLSSYAKGIPDRENYGDLSSLPTDQLLDYVVQRHIANRAGDHRDLRFGSPETGGLLNSSVAKSIEDHRARKIQMRAMLYDIVGFQGTPAERIQKLQQITEVLGDQFFVPEQAEDEESIKDLHGRISRGEHPVTNEGIMLYPREGGDPIKVKNTAEHDVYIRSLFPGKNRFHGSHSGGFAYSHDPEGPVVGEVGTGLSDETRSMMHTNPEEYIGRRARVRAAKRMDSGALFQPSFLSLHEDYSPEANAKIANTRIASTLGLH